jgi:hypothetical protein
MSDSAKDFHGAHKQARQAGDYNPACVYSGGSTPAPGHSPNPERQPLRQEQPSPTVGPAVSQSPTTKISSGSPKNPFASRPEGK